jgi:hypothetical protein
MEAVIELGGLERPGWFAELTRGVGEAGEIEAGSLTLLRAPVGAFGAGAGERFKAHLHTASELAAVIGVAIALYHPGVGTAPNCEVRFSDGATHAALVVPCETNQSPAFVQKVVGTLGELKGEPTSIAISPSRDRPG